MALLTICTAWL